MQTQHVTIQEITAATDRLAAEVLTAKISKMVDETMVYNYDPDTNTVFLQSAGALIFEGKPADAYRLLESAGAVIPEPLERMVWHVRENGIELYIV